MSIDLPAVFSTLSPQTAVFRPKHGTVSNVRVSSKHTTPEVISLLLRKFAVENAPTEFNLYAVMTHGGKVLCTVYKWFISSKLGWIYRY